MTSFTKTYREYFNINPDYFPQVNEAIIKSKPEYWKNYYPHDTFVKLLRDTVKVLERREKLSIWVEGAYGTGKSHAVLTLKKILDATEEETKSYFDKFELSQDLLNTLENQKKSGKIITVHRYGSSSIRNDHQLVFAIQESIENSLKEAGIENKGVNSLSKSILAWLEDKTNKTFLDSLIKTAYSSLFGGDDVNSVINKLQTLEGEALLALMDKIFKVADERGIKVLSLDAKGLSNWIKEVIRVNNLKAIVFIWDEFTEYFYNNTRDLTGFQEIVEISATDPFYLIIVTHKSSGLFSDADKDKKKILDRFVKPTCNIELPENMAIRLMGVALEKNKDPAVAKEWEQTAADLYGRTNDSRNLVKNSARIDDDELKNILPIHPYTALLLKQISSAFQSNQRSMFDFIKNDQGDDSRGFQWFIDNNGPFDDNPLLTIDLLWDFFYERGKENLSADIKSILDTYSRITAKRLSEEQKRVLKTILLMEAISKKVGDSVELFIPDVKNVNNAFEGSDLEGGRASNWADSLVREEILFKKPLGGNKFHYSALINSGDTSEIEKKKEQLKKETTTATLIQNGSLMETLMLPGAVKLRYDLKPISVSDFDDVIRQTRNQLSSIKTNKIITFVAFAKSDDESAVLSKKIYEVVNSEDNSFVFIDTSVTPLGQDGLDQYLESMANSQYQRGKDNTIATQFETNAKEVLKKWKSRIERGEFIISSPRNKDGERILSQDNVVMTLQDYNKTVYPLSLEASYKVNDTMYTPTSLKLGVECAVKQETSGAYKQSNNSYKLENILAGAWLTETYWETNPQLPISKLKKLVDKKATEVFDVNGRISIKEIYDLLTESPYGFMPCNFTAFILGFILKEYANGSYTWSDNYQNEILTMDKLKEMIDEVIKLQTTPNPRYRDKYIVAMTDEEKKFNELTSEIFEIPLNNCTSIETTRKLIRNSMKDFTFPIWTLEYISLPASIQTAQETLHNIIECYVGVANNNNYGSGASETDIALKIGRLYKEYPNIRSDLKTILTKDNCKDGMTNYLKDYESGVLVNLANEISDGGQYINVIRNKFNADAANWVWNKDTCNQIIDDAILEYKIIVESNKCKTKEVSFNDTVRSWGDICEHIKISYEYGKQHFGVVGNFLEALYSIKRSGQIQNKKSFYDLLVSYSNEFKTFYSNQIDVFKTSCGFYLGDLDDNQIEEIFNKLPGCFIKEKSEYVRLIDETVKNYKSSLGYIKLKKYWQEKTGTESPCAWSQKYRMSILCMIPETETLVARKAFDALNRNRPDELSIKAASDYLESASFFESLKDETSRNLAFSKYILKNYAPVLKDIQNVKDYLHDRLSFEEYEWFGLSEIETRIKELAQSEYDKSGCDLALKKIDDMEISDLKKYLKELIKDNLNVGIEIIKG